jgi:hypothetical protein
LGNEKCFKYCFEHCTNPQLFWNLLNEDAELFESSIDLEDTTWRRLFSVDLSRYPCLQNKIAA